MLKIMKTRSPNSECIHSLKTNIASPVISIYRLGNMLKYFYYFGKGVKICIFH